MEKQKTSKKAKRAEKEAQIEREAAAALVKARLEKDKARAQAKAELVINHSLEITDGSATTSFATSASVDSSEMKACNTCGGSFDKESYRQHFRSEWHRFNLKLKMLTPPKPPVDENTFMGLSIEQLSI